MDCINLDPGTDPNLPKIYEPDPDPNSIYLDQQHCSSSQTEKCHLFISTGICFLNTYGTASLLSMWELSLFYQRWSRSRTFTPAPTPQYCLHEGKL